MFIRMLRENSRFTAIVLAVCLAITAQYLFTGEIFTHQLDSNTWVWTANYSLALVMLVTAIALAAWSARGQQKAASETDESSVSSNPRRAWLIASAVSYILSLVLFVMVGENGLVRWLWVGGVVLLVISLWTVNKKGSTKNNVSTREWVLVGLIVLSGFLLRYWKLTEIPSHVDNDIALMGTFGLDLINTGQYNWIGFSGSEHLLSYDQFLAWGMRLFGHNHYGIVMTSVVLGTISLVYIFLLGRELGGSVVGLIAAGLLAISYTHIHFSRILFGNSSSFPAILVILMLLIGVRTREYLWFALSGIFAGVGMLLYDSSRVIPIVLLSVLIWMWLWQRPLLASLKRHWVLLLAGFLLAVGPVLVYAIQNFTYFSGRANVVVLWTPVAWEHQLATYKTTSPMVVLWQQTWRTFLTLHLTGDGSPHFAFQRPMVDPFTAMLFILGVGYAFSKLKDFRYFALLSWVFLTFVMGGVLTADPPYWPHLNIALPSIILIAALGSENFAEKLPYVFGKVGSKVYIWMLAGLIVFTGVQNWGIYYDYVRNNAGNRIRIARYVETLPSSYHVFLVSDNLSWNEFAFRFFSQGTTGTDLTPEMFLAEPPNLESPTVFILFRHPELASVLQELYPDGILENHYDVNNLVSFISYRVVPSTLDAPPERGTANPLSSPGWLLIFGLVISWMGYIAYGHYSSLENDADSEPAQLSNELEESPRRS
ncbi:MAG: glycosyltransferase family 39 protein [Anaerolineales bacterium]|nr:glycosyltransferase family 39 protein [Anaerolineales bacterium]